jgi:hypothetical protein
VKRYAYLPFSDLHRGIEKAGTFSAEHECESRWYVELPNVVGAVVRCESPCCPARE